MLTAAELAATRAWAASRPPAIQATLRALPPGSRVRTRRVIGRLAAAQDCTLASYGEDGTVGLITVQEAGRLAGLEPDAYERESERLRVIAWPADVALVDDGEIGLALVAEWLR